MTENPYLEPPLPNCTNDGFEWPETEAMSDAELKEEMDLLREAVEHHSYLYYVKFTQAIADTTYDALFHRLEELEEALGVEDEDSPTQKVGTGRAQNHKES